MKKDAKLLERRMRGGPIAEKEPTQKIIMVFTSLGFIGLIVFPALDHRFAWSHAVCGAGGGCADSDRLARDFYRIQGKYLYLRDHRIGPRPKSHINWPIRAGPAPDVRRSPRDACRHTDCARFVVGGARHRRDDTRADMETV